MRAQHEQRRLAYRSLCLFYGTELLVGKKDVESLWVYEWIRRIGISKKCGNPSWRVNICFTQTPNSDSLEELLRHAIYQLHCIMDRHPVQYLTLIIYIRAYRRLNPKLYQSDPTSTIFDPCTKQTISYWLCNRPQHISTYIYHLSIYISNRETGTTYLYI